MSLYLHIPFCKSRCAYCDFFSTTDAEKISRYVDALCRELHIRRDYLSGQPVATVYFGGGTPSQLSAKHFEQIFNTLYNIYNILPDAEITLEANPDDLSEAYLQSISSLPFNRLSMGIQTFDDSILRIIHRRHTASQAVEAFRRSRDAGFQNISIDLIYGLPGQTTQLWQHDLDIALSLKPEHISAYCLTYEEGTELSRMRRQGRVVEADEELCEQFFLMLRSCLISHGYDHYEISNFCLPGYHSRHNSSYWDGTKYLGCGPSAHSYDGISRQWNTPSLQTYLDSVANGMPEHLIEQLDLNTRYNDFVITRMRTAKGISLQTLSNLFGAKLYSYCINMAQPHISRGTLELTASTLRLTPKGLFVSDGIMSDLLYV